MFSRTGSITTAEISSPCSAKIASRRSKSLYGTTLHDAGLGLERHDGNRRPSGPASATSGLTDTDSAS